MAHELTSEFDWMAPEYVKNHRGVDWYWVVALLGIVGVFACIWFQNYLFAVIVLLSVVFIFVYSTRDPETYDVRISQVGISIAGRLYTYEQLDMFWVENHPREGYKLLLHSTSKMMPISVVPINESVDVILLRNFLVSRITEREMKEPILLQIFEALF